MREAHVRLTKKNEEKSLLVYTNYKFLQSEFESEAEAIVGIIANGGWLFGIQLYALFYLIPKNGFSIFVLNTLCIGSTFLKFIQLLYDHPM